MSTRRWCTPSIMYTCEIIGRILNFYRVNQLIEFASIICWNKLSQNTKCKDIESLLNETIMRHSQPNNIYIFPNWLHYFCSQHVRTLSDQFMWYIHVDRNALSNVMHIHKCILHTLTCFMQYLFDVKPKQVRTISNLTDCDQWMQCVSLIW